MDPKFAEELCTVGMIVDLKSQYLTRALLKILRFFLISSNE